MDPIIFNVPSLNFLISKWKKKSFFIGNQNKLPKSITLLYVYQIIMWLLVHFMKLIWGCYMPLGLNKLSLCFKFVFLLFPPDSVHWGYNPNGCYCQISPFVTSKVETFPTSKMKYTILHKSSNTCTPFIKNYVDHTSSIRCCSFYFQDSKSISFFLFLCGGGGSLCWIAGCRLFCRWDLWKPTFRFFSLGVAKWSP